MNRDSNSSPINQDDRLEYLESQVEAFKARSSILQQQQIAALDALDKLVLQHDQELEAESKTRQRLELRLRQSEDACREIERERDDLRDAVLQLIEKVENTHHDFKLWPYSKLQVSSHIVPYELPASSRTKESLEQLGYASGIIRSLKDELSLERQAHSLTRSRVSSLEAQIAARDVALQKWVRHPETSILAGLPTQNVVKESEQSTKGKAPDTQRDIDRAGISSLYEQTQAKNRMLEQEVRGLFRNLENARSKAKKSASQLSISPSPLSLSPIMPQTTRETSPPPTSLPDRVPSEPSTPVLRPRRQIHNDSPSFRPDSHLFHNVFQINSESAAGPSRIRPSSRRRTPSPHHPPLSPLDFSRSSHYEAIASVTGDVRDDFPPQLRPQTSTSTRLETAISTSNFEPPSAGHILQHLDDQIHLLSAQIDAFRAERLALLDIVDTQLRGRGSESTAVPRNDSRHDIGSSRPATAAAEEAEEHTQAPRFDVGDGDGVQEHLEYGTDGGERSMDLETPLVSALVSLPDAVSHEQTHSQKRHGTPEIRPSSFINSLDYREPGAVHDLDADSDDPESNVQRLRLTPQSAGNEYDHVNEIRMIRPRIDHESSSS